MKKKNTLRGNTVVKIVVFFLLVINFLAGTAGTAGFVIMANEGVYQNSFRQMAEDIMYYKAGEDYYAVTGVEGFPYKGHEYIEEYCRDSNLSVEIYEADNGILIWGNHKEELSESSYQYTFFVPMYMMLANNSYEWARGYNEQAYANKDFKIILYVDSQMVHEDGYLHLMQQAKTVYQLRYAAPILGGLGILLFFICFVFLMCSAGHQNGREGIIPTPFNIVPLDLLTLIFLMGTGFVMLIIQDVFYAQWVVTACAILAVGAALTVFGTLFCMEVMNRLKRGQWWRNTLCYIVLRWIGRILRSVCRGIGLLLRAIPATIDILLIFGGICILEFVVYLICYAQSELDVIIIFWILERAVFFPAVVYFALVCRKLQKGSEALATGNLAYQLDTSHMMLGFKQHGENLKQIAQGMNTAVEQRIKSEHLKMELITNVSHDLKTPLTSIINYANLIGAQETDNEKITEYAQVLFRQSQRLKRLLENLVEASKATTGDIEVTLQPCEVNVLLSQAVGEYEQRFQEKKLELLTRQPEEQIKILADGRHMWRVFDNLFSNICKYAREDSRVYLSVETEGEKVRIIFRNMSKYALDVSAEELMERFVRGDKSRHMEGNGLGLSIAKSLVELQNGRMETVVDGDLFKVVLIFNRL